MFSYYWVCSAVHGISVYIIYRCNLGLDQGDQLSTCATHLLCENTCIEMQITQINNWSWIWPSLFDLYVQKGMRMLRLILLIHPKKIDKTLVESVKLGKTLELSKIMRMSFLMLDRVNWGHHLGSSYIFEESSHTKA